MGVRKCMHGGRIEWAEGDGEGDAGGGGGGRVMGFCLRSSFSINSSLSFIGSMASL